MSYIKVDYEDLEGNIKDCPITYLPGLLIVVIQTALKKKVFKDGKLLEFVKSVQDKTSQF